MFQLSLWSLPPLAALCLVLATATHLRSNRDIPGVDQLRLLCACLAFWSAGELADSLLIGERAKVIVSSVQYLGVVATPVAWLAFALCYTRHRRRLERATLASLCVFPCVTLLLVATNPAHGLMWTGTELIAHAGVVSLGFAWGPWFVVHAVYSYALVFAATVILAFVLSQSKHHRKPLVAVTAGPAVTLLLNLVYLSPWNPTPGFDPTPLGFTLALLTLNDGVLRAGLLDAVPVVRHRVVERLTDGVVIVNGAGRVIDINPSAVEVLTGAASTSPNRALTELVASADLEPLVAGDEQSTVIQIGLRVFDVNATELDVNTDRRGEKALVFRDVTARQRTENELRRAQQDLERLAHTDFLTSLHNRRYFMQRLREETDRVRRHRTRLSVVLFDLDDFKRVNDAHGHDAGDRVLQVIANVVGELKRSSDVAARIGGEEFAILLPETDAPGALQLAQRLRATIEARRIASQTGQAISVTVSVGVATAAVIAREYDQILISADEALYRAKNRGRNQVCVSA